MSKIIIILIFIFGINSHSELFSKEIPKFVTNIESKIISIDSMSKISPLLILFLHNYNCKQCIEEINNFVKNKDTTQFKLKLLIITRLSHAKYDILNQVKTINEIQEIIDIPEIFFDIHLYDDPWPPKDLLSGFFGYYQINYTPSILIIKNSSKKYLDFFTLFQNKMSFQELISNELNK